MKGAERQKRRGKKRQAKSKTPTEVTGKVVISSRKWGIRVRTGTMEKRW